RGAGGRGGGGGGEAEGVRGGVGRAGAAAPAPARGTDLVDAHFALFAWLPALVLLRDRPLVVHFHGPWAGESTASGASAAAAALKHRLERSVYRRADRLVVLSRAFAEVLVRDYGVERDRVRVVPPGVGLDRFTPDRAGARERLGVPDGARTVFTARRLVQRMGLDVLLDAWAAMERRPGDRLLVAGEGPERAALEAQVERLGLGGSVSLLGRIGEEELVDRYRSADVTVMPSRSLEGFGLTAVEALACGTPVVVTDVGGLPEVVDGLDPSLVVPAGRADLLAQRLERALAGEVPDAAACRAHAETFTWPRAVATHREVYAEAVRARRSAGAGSTGAGSTGAGTAAGAAAVEPLSVVFVDHCARLSGGEIALERLIASLPDVRAHVVLGEDGPLVERLRAAGASVEVLPLAADARDVGRERVGGRLPVGTVVGAAGYTLRLARRVRQLRPDVVHTNSLKASLYGGLAGRLAGVPVVWHARDRIATDYMPAPAARLVRAAARVLPRLVVANSRETLGTLGLPAGARAAVVPDPYAPSAPGAGRDGHDGQDGNGGSGRPLRVGIVGRLSPWKGQDVFLRAFAAACPAPARAVVAGSAMFGEEEYARGLTGLVAELGLGGRVELRGFVEDVEGVLAELDVLVHASTVPEPFGQVVVEALAAGVPVVATRAGGPTEILTDGVDGLLVEPGDVDALADALRRLASSPELRARLAAEGRRRAEAFRPEKIGPLVRDLYEGARR
ncbi:glycosyltransferase, partial [Kineococcus sp. SYSU DK005]|uniref:glycosyltransferase n=1 Tax=Kineococcus sp. SYSU DK005 TaxID=3383126 RepID=UPI003D7C9284